MSVTPLIPDSWKNDPKKLLAISLVITALKLEEDYGDLHETTKLMAKEVMSGNLNPNILIPLDNTCEHFHQLDVLLQKAYSELFDTEEEATMFLREIKDLLNLLNRVGGSLGNMNLKQAH